MICKNCGAQIPENENKCPKCGTDNSPEDLNISAAGVERAVPRGFSAKKNIIIIIIAAILLIGGGITAIAMVSSHSASSGVSDKLQLAERYLNEQNYEQAVIEFQKVLEIEPMNVDAYLGLADAYIGKGEPDKAISALRDGLERTKDDKIKTRLVGELLNRVQDRINSGDYEKAIADLQSVLELDSKNADAYLKLADVYLAQNLTDKALEILREGLEKTSDDRIKRKLDELTKKPETSSASSVVSSEPTISEPVVSEPPVYGSMGSVTILGEEYDIATTTSLNLNRHDITDEQLKEIAPEIEKLTNLTELWLQYNQISDITPLVKFTNLTELYFGNNQISDITPLAKLTNLTELRLLNNQISDITSLAKLTNLICLDLQGNQISDITSLAELTNLTSLLLNMNQISDITPLAKLTNLTILYLSGNQISDITPLSSLTNLTHLDLSNNQISDITPLSSLANLTHLYLSNNQISDITPLANLTNLYEVVYGGNPINGEGIQWLITQLPNTYVYDIMLFFNYHGGLL